MEEKNNNIEIVSDGSQLMSYVEHENTKRNQKIGLTITVIFVVAALLIAFFNRSFNGYDELTHTDNTEGNRTQYEIFLNGYLKYSKDGISFLDQKENIKWTEAFTMNRPVVVVKDEYAAAADLEGNTVYLYNETGKIGQYSMSYPVRNVLIGKQGVFCVVLDGQDVNYIRLYNSSGEMIAEIKTQIKNNGYPMSVAMSSDGSRLAASFYRIDGIDSKNSVSFYNFGEGGKGQSGNLVGTFQVDNMLVPKVAFTDDSTVYAIGDSKMLVFNVKSEPKQMREIVYPSNILNVFCSDEIVGYTCENPIELVETEEADPYEIYIYSSHGRLKKQFGAEKVYENVKVIDNVIVGYTGALCHMFRANGTEVFESDMGRNITNVLPTNSATEFLFVFSESSARIRLKNELVQNKAILEEVETLE